MKYNEVNGCGDKSVKKSSESQRIIKKPEKAQRPEKSKSHWFEKTFTKAQIFC